MCDKRDDAKQFGKDAWVYCKQHLRPHVTGWCTVPNDQKLALDAKNLLDAVAECERKQLRIWKG